MRLYRGLKEPHRPARVLENHGPLILTDFTDCPVTALRYAGGRRGVLLVLDVPEEAEHRVREELWLGQHARRFMITGRFEAFIVASLPAKDMRAVLRRKGMSALADEDKARLFEPAIADVMNGREPRMPALV